VNKDLKNKVRNQTVGYLLAAFGLVAALAWNDAVKALIDSLFPISTSSLWLKFFYAIIVTVAVVLLGQYLLKQTDDDK
jgi:hypothetical protein